MEMFHLLFFLSIICTASALEESTKSTFCTAKLLEDKKQYSRHLNSSGPEPLLLHHIQSPCSPLDDEPLSDSDLLDRDNRRVAALISRLSGDRGHPTPDDLVYSKGKVPLKPGKSFEVGNYVTRIGLGTPAKEYVVVVDSGSSLSWVQCKPCKLSCHKQLGPIFDPKASSSYSTVACGAPECKSLHVATLNPAMCTADKVCIYQATYGDNSFSVGYLSKETLRLGDDFVLSNFAFGCGQDNEGLFGETSGLIGLARDRLSMLSQLSHKYGNVFSYCLPTASTSSGYLSLGESSSSSSGYSYTPMLSSSKDASLYFLKLVSIHVAGRPIPASAAATLNEIPTIIDSGTVITRLPSAAYTALSRGIVAALRGHPRAPAFSILDTCFKGSYKMLNAPEVSLVFAGGAEMKLSAHNVFYDLHSKGITCLAFAADSRTAIIGNRQQETFRVVYDVARRRIGFAPGGCS